MIREITESDGRLLAFEDPDWTEEQFANLLGTPGAWGLYDGVSFVVGIGVEDELFMERFLLNEGTDLDEFWREVGLRYKKCHMDLPLDFKHPETIFALLDAGWTIMPNGMMKVRMTLAH